MRRTTENAWYFFYALLFIFLLAILAIDVWGQEQKPSTMEEQKLDYQFRYGQQLMINAQLKAQNIALQKKLKEAKAKISQLEMKPEEKEN